MSMWTWERTEEEKAMSTHKPKPHDKWSKPTPQRPRKSVISPWEVMLQLSRVKPTILPQASSKAHSWELQKPPARREPSLQEKPAGLRLTTLGHTLAAETGRCWGGILYYKTSEVQNCKLLKGPQKAPPIVYTLPMEHHPQAWQHLHTWLQGHAYSQ